MTRLRIGCVGTGFIANKHLTALSRFDDVEIVAVADPLADRAEKAAAQVGARAYDDGLALIESEPLDAVYLCVPPYAHGPLEAAALDRGLPFFVEKPLALDLETALSVARAVEAQGLVTAVGYHWRYLDTVEALQQVSAETPARLLLGYWLDFTPTAPWWSRRAGSGGQLLEQATHLFDLARLFAGDVEEVHTVASRSERERFPDADIPDVSTTSLRFASGAVGSISSTCLLGWHDRIGLTVVAEGTTAELTEKELRITTQDGIETSAASVDPFSREDRDFVDAVRGTGASHIRVPYAEALRTHLVTTAAVRSATEKVSVRVPRLEEL